MEAMKTISATILFLIICAITGYLTRYQHKPIHIHTQEQVKRTQEILDTFKTDKMSSQLASLSLNKFLQ